MKANFVFASTLSLLIIGHNVNCYSQLERRNFLEDEINQGMRTTPRPTQPLFPHLIPSPASPLWPVLNERESPEFKALPKDTNIDDDDVLDTIDDLELYDDYKNPKETAIDIKDYTGLSQEDSSEAEKNDEKRYFSSLGGAYIHGKRDGTVDKRYFDSIGGSHVFKRASDNFDNTQQYGYKRALDSLGGWQIHGYKRQFDSLGGANLHNDNKRFISSLGGGLIHGSKRGFDTLGGMNLHGYKRFVSSLGGGNIHSGVKRGLDTLGGANLHSGYKRYISSLGGSNIHGYKRGLSSLGGGNVHNGYKRQDEQYGDPLMLTESKIPTKRQLDSLGGFTVHRFKRSRLAKPDNDKAAED